VFTECGKRYEVKIMGGNIGRSFTIVKLNSGGYKMFGKVYNRGQLRVGLVNEISEFYEDLELMCVIMEYCYVYKIIGGWRGLISREVLRLFRLSTVWRISVVLRDRLRSRSFRLKYGEDELESLYESFSVFDRVGIKKSIKKILKYECNRVILALIILIGWLWMFRGRYMGVMKLVFGLSVLRKMRLLLRSAKLKEEVNVSDFGVEVLGLNLELFGDIAIISDGLERYTIRKSEIEDYILNNGEIWDKRGLRFYFDSLVRKSEMESVRNNVRMVEKIICDMEVNDSGLFRRVEFDSLRINRKYIIRSVGEEGCTELKYFDNGSVNRLSLVALNDKVMDLLRTFGFSEYWAMRFVGGLFCNCGVFFNKYYFVIICRVLLGVCVIIGYFMYNFYVLRMFFERVIVCCEYSYIWCRVNMRFNKVIYYYDCFFLIIEAFVYRIVMGVIYSIRLAYYKIFYEFMSWWLRSRGIGRLKEDSVKRKGADSGLFESRRFSYEEAEADVETMRVTCGRIDVPDMEDERYGFHRIMNDYNQGVSALRSKREYRCRKFYRRGERVRYRRSLNYLYRRS
jgi:hypothetical protein